MNASLCCKRVNLLGEFMQDLLETAAITIFFRLNGSRMSAGCKVDLCNNLNRGRHRCQCLNGSCASGWWVSNATVPEILASSEMALHLFHL